MISLSKSSEKRFASKQGVSPKCHCAITEREYRLLLTALHAPRREGDDDSTIAVSTNPIVL